MTEEKKGIEPVPAWNCPVCQESFLHEDQCREHIEEHSDEVTAERCKLSVVIDDAPHDAWYAFETVRHAYCGPCGSVVYDLPKLDEDQLFVLSAVYSLDDNPDRTLKMRLRVMRNLAWRLSAIKDTLSRAVNDVERILDYRVDMQIRDGDLQRQAAANDGSGAGREDSPEASTNADDKTS